MMKRCGNIRRLRNWPRIRLNHTCNSGLNWAGFTNPLWRSRSFGKSCAWTPARFKRGLTWALPYMNRRSLPTRSRNVRTFFGTAPAIRSPCVTRNYCGIKRRLEPQITFPDIFARAHDDHIAQYDKRRTCDFKQLKEIVYRELSNTLKSTRTGHFRVGAAKHY